MSDLLHEVQTQTISRRRFLIRVGKGAGLVGAASASGLLGHALRQQSAAPSGAYGVGPMGGSAFAGK